MWWINARVPNGSEYDKLMEGGQIEVAIAVRSTTRDSLAVQVPRVIGLREEKPALCEESGELAHPIPWPPGISECLDDQAAARLLKPPPSLGHTDGRRPKNQRICRPR
jgi:hypothetical protein